MTQMTTEQMEKRVAELAATIRPLKDRLFDSHEHGWHEVMQDSVLKQAEMIDLLCKLLAMANTRIDELLEQERLRSFKREGDL